MRQHIPPAPRADFPALIFPSPLEQGEMLLLYGSSQQSELILKGIHERQLHNNSSSNNKNKPPDGTSMNNF
jgi:hypothetical protein